MSNVAQASFQDSMQPPKSRSKEILISFLRLAIVAVIIYFIYRQVAANWQEIKAHQWTIDWLTALLAVVIGLTTFLIMATVWRAIIGAFGHRIRIRDAFRIFYLADLGRYIPGKVWAFLGVLYLSKQKGIEPEQAGASFVMVQMFAIPASLLVFVVCAQLEPNLLIDQVSFLGKTSAYVLTGLMVLLSLMVIFVPGPILKIANAILRKFKRPEVAFCLDKTVALAVFLGYCIGWICYGTAFWLFVRAIVPDSGLGMVAGIGLFNAAYQIGYLTLIAPGGFGPREFVMGTMLIPFVGPIGPAVAIGARLWVIVVELSAAAIALTVRPQQPGS